MYKLIWVIRFSSTQYDTNHRLITIQIEPLDVVFSRYRGFVLNFKTERVHTGNSFGLLPQGYCEEKLLNLEKNYIQSSICIVINL